MRKLKINSICLAALAAGLVAGCGREEAPPAAPAEAPAPAAGRMEDPEYLQALDRQNAERKDIMKALAEAERKYAAAAAVDPESAEAKALRAEMDAVKARFDANRAASRQIVGERLRKDFKNFKESKGNNK